jgi:ABC-type amino acid transport substrate-binding protein
MRLRRLLLLLLLAPCSLQSLLAPPPLRAATSPVGAERVLRVGMVDGSAPCSSSHAGSWQGLAVDLWSRVAGREALPYVIQTEPTSARLLEATRQGRIDVAVGCLNVSPERLRTTRFSLPFQEDGLAVMVVKSRLDLGRAFLGSLLGPTLLQLLGGFLLIIGGLSLLTWRVERYDRHPDTLRLGRRRSFARIVQILATGPGGNTLVETTRGDVIVIVAYLVRIVVASLLVGYLTVTVAQESEQRNSGNINDLEDLRGLRVAARPDTVSTALLRELNRAAPGAGITIVPLPRIERALDLLRRGQADAVLGDNLQLTWLVANTGRDAIVPRLALQGIRPESQAFAFAPSLPETTAERINLAISALKRSGEVGILRQEAAAR